MFRKTGTVRNVARHLAWANCGAELGGLLLDARWTEVRTRIGGVLGLKSDFDVLDECLQGWEGSEEEKALIGEVRGEVWTDFQGNTGFMGKSGQGLEGGSIPSMRASGILEEVDRLVVRIFEKF